MCVISAVLSDKLVERLLYSLAQHARAWMASWVYFARSAERNRSCSQSRISGCKEKIAPSWPVPGEMLYSRDKSSDMAITSQNR